MFNSPNGGVPWDDLRKFLSGCQWVVTVQNGVERFPKISIAWVGRTSVTDDRQTDGRWHIANVNVSSRSLKNWHATAAAVLRLPGRLSPNQTNGIAVSGGILSAIWRLALPVTISQHAASVHSKKLLWCRVKQTAALWARARWTILQRFKLMKVGRASSRHLLSIATQWQSTLNLLAVRKNEVDETQTYYLLNDTLTWWSKIGCLAKFLFVYLSVYLFGCLLIRFFYSIITMLLVK